MVLELDRPKDEIEYGRRLEHYPLSTGRSPRGRPKEQVLEVYPLFV
jgi:hypothetical protein